MRAQITHRMEKVGPETVAILDDVTHGTFTFRKSGWLRAIEWTSSDYASAATFTIAIADADGFTLYTSNALAHDSSGYIADVDRVIVDEEHTVTVTTGDPGVGGASIEVTLLMER